MNGVHDMGGVRGYGPVVGQADEERFGEHWERGAFGLVMAGAMQGLWTGDEHRHAIERMGNVAYLTTPYYAKWLEATERLLIEHGVIDADEWAARVQAARDDPDRFARPPAPEPDDLARRLVAMATTGGSSARAVDVAPRFSPGDAVRTVRADPPGHTRLPSYARDRAGTVVAYRGTHVFPDANAHGLGEQPQPLYTVRFEAAELWGEGRARDAVHLELWEPYLT